MAAPKGNQFWKIRNKHGRDKLFESSALLWDAAVEYFQWCDKNPWYRTDFKGKDADRVEIPTARPYTMTGLCLYLDCGKNYFEQFKAKHLDDDFSGVITRIEETIYTQKFEGAVVGAFNANIISRDLGLTDKVEQLQQVTVTVKRQRKERPEHG